MRFRNAYWHFFMSVNDPKKRLWKQGRAFLYYGLTPNPDRGTWNHVGFEWYFGLWQCGIGITADSDNENELKLHIAIPLLGSFWFVHTLPAWIRRRLPHKAYTFREFAGSYPVGREVSLSFHDWTLWWHLWEHPHGGWSGVGDTEELYRWQHGYFDMRHAILGQQQCEHGSVGLPINAYVRMPEGLYPVTIQRKHSEWWYARWPWVPLRIVRDCWDINCEIGIPFPGKGENSWDCGEDGLYGIGCDLREAPTTEEACKYFAARVLDYRKRYGGVSCAAAPWPETPEVRQQKVAVAQSQASTIAKYKGQQHG